MKLADLSPEVIEKIKPYRYDHFLEKHEGPWDWDSVLKYYEPEIMTIHGFPVLLPIASEQHPNIEILRCIVGEGQKSLTVFLKDRTYVSDPDEELFAAGRVAICDRFEGENFYLAIVYHEWFIVEN